MGIAILHLKPKRIPIKRQTFVQVSDEQHGCNDIANHGVHLSSFFVVSERASVRVCGPGPFSLVQAQSASILNKRQYSTRRRNKISPFLLFSEERPRRGCKRARTRP